MAFICWATKRQGRSLSCQGRWYLRHRLLAHEYKAGRCNMRFILALSLHEWMGWSRFNNMKLAWGHRETPPFFNPISSNSHRAVFTACASVKKSFSWPLKRTPPNLQPATTPHQHTPFLHPETPHPLSWWWGEVGRIPNLSSSCNCRSDGHTGFHNCSSKNMDQLWTSHVL